MRVALQTVLRRAFPDEEGQRQYKNLMLHVITQIGLAAMDIRAFVPADYLEIIRAKIARRISKLKEAVYGFVAEQARSAESAMRAVLKEIQLTIEETDSTTVPGSFAQIQQDMQITLDNSSDYLEAAISRNLTEVTTSRFDRHYDIRNQRDRHGLPIPRSDDLLSLLDFERWVEFDMGGWAEMIEPSEDICCELAKRLDQYTRYTTETFVGSPETVSLMILTLLEGWVTLDRMCIAICPLLEKYTPEIPVTFLEPLLLPQHCQMRRAKKVDDYIVNRHRKGSSSIFLEPEPQSFAISYYDTSHRHRQLRQRIERHAQHSIDEKRKEWEEKSSQYSYLHYQAAQLEHEWVPNTRGKDYHASSCRRCSLENQASNISIEIYEWPLPEKESDLKTVIFELDCPHWFAAWRDVTWKLVQDFGRRELKKASNMEQNLLKYSETNQFAVKWGQRVTLGSNTKSWRRTHYNSRFFPVNFDDITCPNAFQFKLLDCSDNGWMIDQTEYPTVKPLCTYRLQHDVYSSLQYAVNSFRHTENQVIADQAQCHPNLSPHEFIAFGCLRAGERVQWLNMLRELASSTLSMNEESVGLLFRQAAWELGTSNQNTGLREAHRVFENESFRKRLLETLEHRLDSIEANWNEHHTLQTLVVIGLRALSLSKDNIMIERTAAFLRRCRQATMKWIEDLISSLSSQRGSQSQAQQMFLIRVGGVCQLTYAVELQHLPVLLHSPEDLFHLICASIVVFENTPPELKSGLTEANVAWVQTSRILHRVEERTRELIQQDALGLNNAIKRSVESLVITEPWDFDQGSLSRWATNQTAADGVRQQQQVRYDLLSGELLVDNCPPGRLPDHYTRDPSFQRLFGLVSAHDRTSFHSLSHSC
jgi:hypothetical protein